jgi:hypothetical protein
VSATQRVCTWSTCPRRRLRCPPWIVLAAIRSHRDSRSVRKIDTPQSASMPPLHPVLRASPSESDVAGGVALCVGDRGRIPRAVSAGRDGSPCSGCIFGAGGQPGWVPPRDAGGQHSWAGVTEPIVPGLGRYECVDKTHLKRIPLFRATLELLAMPVIHAVSTGLQSFVQSRRWCTYDHHAAGGLRVNAPVRSPSVGGQQGSELRDGEPLSGRRRRR